MASKMHGIELFRVPDEYGDDWAIWYGAGGKEGESAVAVNAYGGLYYVSEVQYVADLLEDPDDDFLVTRAYVDLVDVLASKLGAHQDEVEELLESTGSQEKMRMAASIGVEQIDEEGGEESWASTLEEGINEALF